MTEKIQEWIYSRKGELLDTLSQLIAIPSVKGEAKVDAPFGEEPKKAMLKMQEFCEKFGFTTKIVGDAVLCADYLPNGGEAELGILAHLDVVPVEPQDWDTDPFVMTEKNGVLYGRGVIDDKGPAVAALYSLMCVKELGLPLKKGVRLIFGTDEENGSGDLVIFRKHEKFPPKVFTPDGSFPIINIEKGMLRSRFEGEVKCSGILSFNGGKIPNAVPDRAEVVLRGVSVEQINAVVAEKKTEAVFTVSEQNSDVKVVCKGRSAHASTPDSGVNAITALISLVNNLIDEPVLKGLEKLFPFGEVDGSSIGIKSSDESGVLTCVLSILNISNGKIRGTVDVRFPTCRKLAEIKDAETSAFNAIGLGLGECLGVEPHIVPEDDDFVQCLLRVYERVEGEKGHCVAIGGGTYVHEIDGGVAFGAERGTTDYHMHGENEFITVDELLKDAVLFAEAIFEICK